MHPTRGSSPLARGLPKSTIRSHGRSGIIPARAGFTAKGTYGTSGSLDHPRSRGVYMFLPTPHCDALGSSPLARGLHGAMRVIGEYWRIIPARAGFTTGGDGFEWGVEDHPRSRGVYVRRARLLRMGRGSSPLARGLREECLRGTHLRWIIPARAGFTFAAWISATVPLDHPRSRGVYHKVSLN